MPYIEKKHREELEEKIEDLVDLLKKIEIETGKVDGVVNYTTLLILLRSMKPRDGWNYSSLMRVIGTLECVKQEIYSELVSAYEELACVKNGTIPELQDEAMDIAEKAIMLTHPELQELFNNERN